MSDAKKPIGRYNHTDLCSAFYWTSMPETLEYLGVVFMGAVRQERVGTAFPQFLREGTRSHTFFTEPD